MAHFTPGLWEFEVDDLGLLKEEEKGRGKKEGEVNGGEGVREVIENFLLQEDTRLGIDVLCKQIEQAQIQSQQAEQARGVEREGEKKKNIKR